MLVCMGYPIMHLWHGTASPPPVLAESGGSGMGVVAVGGVYKRNSID